MVSKVCTKCNVLKEIFLFSFRKERKSYRSVCKECEAKFSRDWRKNNIDKSRKAAREYSHLNKESIKKFRRDSGYYKKYYQKNKTRISKNTKKYREKIGKDLIIRSRIYNKKSVDILSDGYIKHLIVKNSFFSRTIIPQNLINLKRYTILIKRKLKEINDEKRNGTTERAQ